MTAQSKVHVQRRRDAQRLGWPSWSTASCNGLRLSVGPEITDNFAVARKSSALCHFETFQGRFERAPVDREEKVAFRDGGGTLRYKRLLSNSVTLALVPWGAFVVGRSSADVHARAMIASAYTRQLRSGLPFCCMHGYRAEGWDSSLVRQR